WVLRLPPSLSSSSWPACSASGACSCSSRPPCSAGDAMPDATTSGPAVSCRDVRKHFGSGEARVEALRGVDFETRFGELSFLVGPSGCGKTTLISIIAGLLDRSDGTLSVLG